MGRGCCTHRSYGAVMGWGTCLTSWDGRGSAADAAELLSWEVWAFSGEQ